MAKKHTKKNVIYKTVFLGLVGLAVLALVFVALEKTHVTHFTKPHTTPAAATQGPTPAQQKQAADADAAAKKQAVESPVTGQAPAAPAASNITLTARTETNGTVTIITQLKNIGNGTCNLTVTNDGKTTTQSADVIYQPEYSTCAGFSVPINSVGSGSWAIKLVVTSNGATATQTITYEVK